MKMSIREAINQTLHQEMARDERVIVLGEDVASDQGGVYGITEGLPAKFGLHRVIDTPITESAIVGAAGGAALTGLRPVAELMFVDFLGVCLDQILNQIAKFRYMFGGQARTPVVIRTMIGAGTGTGPQHSQILYPLLAAIPGIKVVTPANAADAKGLLTTAIRDDDPVIFCEHKALYMDECEVPEGEYLLPFGQARTAVQGSDITIVGMSRTAVIAEQAAAELAQKGVSAEVIDLRTLSPLDESTILESLAKTGRLVVVDESNPYCSMASEIAGLAVEQGFDTLDAPVKRITSPHTPVPATPCLEAEYVPNVARVIAAVEETLAY
ncbi:MAG: alpha-ketoacid dehydrogenase subunit beta [Luminiphilus sp.]|jgi:pyruvate dehydrogenase E1 component beta subunit|nr:alpha-ketoacid dehydrogenase subunit beta [Luminiphilus sp.]MDG1683571.1 alpha-ketoacid dehydrogenase subunit beta [Luminiphilus sp.]